MARGSEIFGNIRLRSHIYAQVQVEDFKDAELMLDITEHTLVPEHQVKGANRQTYRRKEGRKERACVLS